MTRSNALRPRATLLARPHSVTAAVVNVAHCRAIVAVREARHTCFGNAGSSRRVELSNEHMRRTKAAAWETRNQILDAAEHVFVARGVAATTLSHIASTAGVTRGAIYWHFQNKEDLFASMVERAISPTETLIKEAGDTREPDPLGCMRRVFVASLRGAACDPRASRVLNVMFTKCELGDESGPVLARRRTAADRLRICLQGALRNAMGRRQLPLGLDVEFASGLLLALWTGVLQEWLIVPAAIALDKDAERIADSWLDILRYSPTCLARA